MQSIYIFVDLADKCSFSPVPVVLVPAPPALRRLRGWLGAGQRLALLQRRDRPLPSRQARRHPDRGRGVIQCHCDI